MNINVRRLLMLVSFAGALLAVSSCARQPIVAAAVQAQETVQVPVAAVGGVDGSRKIEALVRRPSAGSGQTKYPAVILLHSAWGWADDHEGVKVYAEALSGAGYVTLEPRMFPGPYGQGDPPSRLPELFGVLRYAATRPAVDPNRIAVSGFSYGGILSIVAATKWANDVYTNGLPRVAAYAPFYPVCWLLKASLKGRPSPVPPDAWLEWTGAPVRIFAGGKDDYDDRDPNACQEAIDSLPELGRKSFSVKEYASATHGWDQRRAASFYEALACKGRGCNNSNAPDAQVTQQSIKDLIEFLGTAMPAQTGK
jgi:dienelactone hydrolase